MRHLVIMLFVGFSVLNFALCNENNKADKELSNFDFYLEKGFINDTFSYNSMYFKMRFYNRGKNAVHLFLEKYEIPQANIFNIQPLKKTGSIFMKDSAGNKLNELLLWPLYPAKITINPNKQIDVLLIGAIKGLVNADPQKRPDSSQLHKTLLDQIKKGPYYYYNLDDKGRAVDSFEIHLDKNFSITYRAPMVGD